MTYRYVKTSIPTHVLIAATDRMFPARAKGAAENKTGPPRANRDGLFAPRRGTTWGSLRVAGERTISLGHALVGPPGIEPRSAGYEPDALPLSYGPATKL